MDLGTIIGLVGSLMIVVVVLILDGGTPAELFTHPSAILLTLGGSLTATIMSSAFKASTKLPVLIMLAFRQNHFEEMAAIESLSSMADKARREGLLALEEESKKITDPFLQKGIMMVVDGVDPNQVRQVLETSIDEMRVRHKMGYSLFNTAGGFAPTFGIIGTVMGLISVLKSLSDPNKLASSIGAAFLATLWGLLSANLIWMPLGSKLKSKSDEEAAYRHMMLEGVLAIQAGENPRIVREKLLAYLPPKEAAKESTAAGAEAQKAKA
ncbi:MAG TPA: motility protein A [Anaerolineaceae bacterium]